MGMYTELNIGVNLAPDTPENVIAILKYMTGDETQLNFTTPNHPLFTTEQWEIMLCCRSCYFAGVEGSFMEKDNILGQWKLSIRCSLKNYDSEIQKFMDFIQPYLDTYGFLGYMRYEEYAYPTLIYNDGKEIYYK